MSLVSVAVELMMHGLSHASLKKPKQDSNGNSVFRLPYFYGVLGVIAAVAGVALLLFGIFTCKPGEEMIVLGIFIMLEGLGVPLVLAGLVMKIVVTPAGIKQSNLIGKVKEVRWKEINALTFNKTTLELKIKSPFNTIKAHQHLVGFPYLVKEIEERTKLTIT